MFWGRHCHTYKEPEETNNPLVRELPMQNLGACLAFYGAHGGLPSGGVRRTNLCLQNFLPAQRFGEIDLHESQTLEDDFFRGIA